MIVVIGQQKNAKAVEHLLKCFPSTYHHHHFCISSSLKVASDELNAHMFIPTILL